MNKYDGPERRYIRRHHVNCVSILYRHPRFLGLVTSDLSRPCEVADINWRGIRFFADSRLHRGCTIDLVFDCIVDSGLDRNSAPIKAKVAWQKWSKRHEAYRTGVVFLELHDRERDAILKMLEGVVAFDHRHYDEDEETQ